MWAALPAAAQYPAEKGRVGAPGARRIGSAALGRWRDAPPFGAPDAVGESGGQRAIQAGTPRKA
jgi:hypothetical protein